MSSAPADRLAELRRQRALVAEHLAWLDREIARGGVSEPLPAATEVAHKQNVEPAVDDEEFHAAAARGDTAIGSPAIATVGAAEVVLDEYRVNTGDVRRDVRKGCLIYFIVAFVLFGLGVAGLYMAFRR